MASLVSRLWTKLLKKRPVISIMIVGLDNSGKTSILNNLATLNQPRSSQEPLSSLQQQQSSADNKSASSSSDTASRSPAASNIRTRQQGNSVSGDNVTPTVGYNYERIQYKGLTFTALDFSGQNRYRNLWSEFYNCIDAIVFVIDSSDLIRLVVVRDELETLLSHPYFGTLPDGETESNEPDDDNTNSDGRLLAMIAAQKQITLNQGKLVQSPLDQSTFNSSVVANRGDSSSGSNNNKARRRLKIPILFLANKSDLANSVDTEVIVRALNLNQLQKSRHPWLIQATSVNLNQGIGEGFNWLVSQLAPEPH